MITRREPGPTDVVIDIAYTGICHSDIQYAQNKSGNVIFPLIPGHEIAGRVAQIGGKVERFRPGDRVGVGCMVDSCRDCESCRLGLEQYCSGKRVLTYNAIGYDGEVTYGGYSERIVVDERFVLRIPDTLPLERAAPLLCAGITMYSPMRHHKIGPGKRVGVLGMGGLGHVGVQIARALGASVVVFELDPAKEADSRRLGVDDFCLSSDDVALQRYRSWLDLIISTVPANIDMETFLNLLRLDGTFVMTGVPPQPPTIPIVALLNNRRSVSGTRSGGLPETQEMLDFCARHDIGAEVEIIGADDIDRAYERVEAGDVRYRFVIDINTMKNEDAGTEDGATP